MAECVNCGNKCGIFSVYCEQCGKRIKLLKNLWNIILMDIQYLVSIVG